MHSNVNRSASTPVGGSHESCSLNFAHVDHRSGLLVYMDDLIAWHSSLNHDIWASLLPFVQLAYNTSFSATVHETPFFIMFGRPARLPVTSSSESHTSAARWTQRNSRSKLGKTYSSRLNLPVATYVNARMPKRSPTNGCPLIRFSSLVRWSWYTDLSSHPMVPTTNCSCLGVVRTRFAAKYLH